MRAVRKNMTRHWSGAPPAQDHQGGTRSNRDLEHDDSSPLRRPDRSRATMSQRFAANRGNKVPPLASLKRGGYPARVGTTGDSTPTHPARGLGSADVAAERRLTAPPLPARRFFLFGRHTNLQRAGQRFIGKSRCGASKATTPALAARSLWAMACESRPAKQRLFLPAIAHNRCSARDHAESRA